MPQRLWRATIKLPNATIQEIFIHASNFFNAKAMIEAQYGKGSIFAPPREVG